MDGFYGIVAEDNVYFNKLSDHSIRITKIDVHYKENYLHNNVPDANKNATENGGSVSD